MELGTSFHFLWELVLWNLWWIISSIFFKFSGHFHISRVFDILRGGSGFDWNRFAGGSCIAQVVLNLLYFLLRFCGLTLLNDIVDGLILLLALVWFGVRSLGKASDWLCWLWLIWKFVDDFLYHIEISFPSPKFQVHSVDLESRRCGLHLPRRDIFPSLIHLLQVGQKHLHRDLLIYSLLWSLVQISNVFGISFFENCSIPRIKLLLQKFRAILIELMAFVVHQTIIMINALFKFNRYYSIL